MVSDVLAVTEQGRDTFASVTVAETRLRWWVELAFKLKIEIRWP
jgi:hypothetical protein